MTITGRQHVAISGSLPSNKLSNVEKDPAMLWQIWTRASPIKKKTLPASILESKPGNGKYMEIHGKTNALSIFLQHSSAHSSVIFRFQLSFATPIAKLPCLILPQGRKSHPSPRFLVIEAHTALNQADWLPRYSLGKLGSFTLRFFCLGIRDPGKLI